MPYGGTTPEQDKKIERCVSDLVKKGTPKERAIPICKSSVMGKKEESEPVIYENVSLNWNSPITLVESIESDKNSRKIAGMALPAAESRNGRTYKLEDIKTARFGGKGYAPGTELLIGLDHSTTVTDNVGKWVPTFEDNGIGFKGVAFNTGKHPYITDMLDKKLLPFVSIEAMADLVKEGEVLCAKKLDILGMDFVKHPGMVDANVGLAEAFEKGINEAPKDDKQSIGDEMTKEEIVEQEEEQPSEEQEEEKEEPKSEESTDSSLIEKIFKKLDESTEAQKELGEKIKKLEEKPKSKGVVTESQKPEFNLKIEKRRDGCVDIYSEDVQY